MNQIQTGIEIKARPEQVWTVLTDFALYQNWNPFICSISGIPKKGNSLRIRARSGLKRMSFNATVILAEPPLELTWSGHLFIPGLFQGEHSCLIELLSDKRVYFRQNESFSGVISPFIRWGLERFTKKGFIEMNRALKKRVEALYPLREGPGLFAAK